MAVAFIILVLGVLTVILTRQAFMISEKISTTRHDLLQAVVISDRFAAKNDGVQILNPFVRSGVITGDGITNLLQNSYYTFLELESILGKVSSTAISQMLPNVSNIDDYYRLVNLSGIDDNNRRIEAASAFIKGQEHQQLVLFNWIIRIQVVTILLAFWSVLLEKIRRRHEEDATNRRESNRVPSVSETIQNRGF